MTYACINIRMLLWGAKCYSAWGYWALTVVVLGLLSRIPRLYPILGLPVEINDEGSSSYDSSTISHPSCPLGVSPGRERQGRELLGSCHNYSPIIKQHLSILWHKSPRWELDKIASAPQRMIIQMKSWNKFSALIQLGSRQWNPMALPSSMQCYLLSLERLQGPTGLSMNATLRAPQLWPW